MTLDFQDGFLFQLIPNTVNVSSNHHHARILRSYLRLLRVNLLNLLIDVVHLRPFIFIQLFPRL